MSTTSGLPTEEPKTTKQKILEAGASLLQSKQPIKAFKQHLMSVSSLAGEPTKQFLLHHFVNTFNEDFAQALLYDGDLADSKLVGIQYIVSDKVYLTLPEEERKLWYPLQYMVRNGLLVAPSLPAMAEKPLMARLLASYSKTFLFWQTGLNPLPVGIPQILSSISTDGQVNKTLSTNLLDTAKIELADLMKRREAIDSNPVLPGAPHSHEVYQLFLQRVGGPQNQNQMGSNYPSGISETYGETPLTGTHTTGTPLTGTSGLTGRSYDTSSPSTEIYTASGLAGATAAGAGAYGASRLTDTHHTSSPHTTTPLTGTSGLTGRSYDTSTPLTGTTYATSTTPLTEAERIRLTEHTTVPSTGTHTHTTTPGYTHTTTPGTSGYTHTTTPLAGTSGYTHTTTPLAGTSGYTHTTPLAGTSGYTHTTTPSTGTYTTGTTPLSGTTYGTTGTTNTPLTEAERNRLTGTNHPAAVSHQAAVDNVAAGLLGGEHGHAPKRDVVTSTNLPGSTSSAAYPYHTSTSTSTDYTAQ